MPEEVRLSFVPNPGTIDPSFCYLHMVTDTDLMQAAAEKAFPIGEDGLVQVAVQHDCIRLYVQYGSNGKDIPTWQDELYLFVREWFQQRYPDCSIFHQDPPEAPPTLTSSMKPSANPIWTPWLR